MYGVFFMSESMRPTGVEDQTIFLFDTEDDANQFVLETLIECGEIIQTDDGDFAVPYPPGGPPSVWSRGDDAVGEVQERFGINEFLHVYQVVDHR